MVPGVSKHIPLTTRTYGIYRLWNRDAVRCGHWVSKSCGQEPFSRIKSTFCVPWAQCLQISHDHKNIFSILRSPSLRSYSFCSYSSSLFLSLDLCISFCRDKYFFPFCYTTPKLFLSFLCDQMILKSGLLTSSPDLTGLGRFQNWFFYVAEISQSSASWEFEWDCVETPRCQQVIGLRAFGVMRIRDGWDVVM